MLYLMTAIDQQGAFRQFVCQLPLLDTWFGVLSDVVAQGHKLVSAEIQDQDQVTSLSVDLFNDRALRTDIHQLEEQAMAVLVEGNALASGEESAHVLRLQHQLTLCTDLVIRSELKVTKLGQFYQRLTDNPNERTETISRHYQVVLRSYERQASKAHELRQLLLKHIDKLNGQ